MDRFLVNLSSTLQTSELRNGVTTSTRSREQHYEQTWSTRQARGNRSVEGVPHLRQDTEGRSEEERNTHCADPTGLSGKERPRSRQAGWQGIKSEDRGNAVGSGIFLNAMTSWETAKVFLSKLASSEVPNRHKDDEELELSLRFPEHSSWHLLPEDGDAVGIQLRSMYGFRTATANWPRDWKKTLSEVGYAVGQAARGA